MKKQTKIALIIGILVIIAIAFFYPRLSNQGGISQSPAASPGGSGGSSQNLPVSVIKLKKETLRYQARYFPMNRSTSALRFQVWLPESHSGKVNL
jgi:hypothetical protein